MDKRTSSSHSNDFKPSGGGCTRKETSLRNKLLTNPYSICSVDFADHARTIISAASGACSSDDNWPHNTHMTHALDLETDDRDPRGDCVFADPTYFFQNQRNSVRLKSHRVDVLVYREHTRLRLWQPVQALEHLRFPHDIVQTQWTSIQLAQETTVMLCNQHPAEPIRSDGMLVR
jgi:hypothetical protein